METVAKVELDRYLGKWFEIAQLPFKYEDGATDITATYSLIGGGNVGVLNECLKDGKVKAARGTAKVVDKVSGAKLKVTFFWPFYGDYWIIKLGENYEYSVVGTPNRKYLWILCRTPKMDQTLYSELVEFAKSKGFNIDNLLLTVHR